MDRCLSYIFSLMVIPLLIIPCGLMPMERRNSTPAVFINRYKSGGLPSGLRSVVGEAGFHDCASRQDSEIYGLKIRLSPFDQDIPASEADLYKYANQKGLDECHSRSCILSRGGSWHALRNPQVGFSRILFEDYVIEQVRKKKDPSQVLVATGLGTGRLMQTIVFLWKLNHFYGFKKFVLNLIDSTYEFDISNIVSNGFLERRDDGIAVVHSLFDEQSPSASWLLQAARSFSFKGLDIQLFFFDSIEKYQHVCSLNSSLKSDFLVSTDNVLGFLQRDSLIQKFVELFQSTTLDDAMFFILCSPKYKLWPIMFSGHKNAANFTLESLFTEFILTPSAGMYEEDVKPAFEPDPETPTTSFDMLQKKFDGI